LLSIFIFIFLRVFDSARVLFYSRRTYSCLKSIVIVFDRLTGVLTVSPTAAFFLLLVGPNSLVLLGESSKAI
jgi:hypothetical protein